MRDGCSQDSDVQMYDFEMSELTPQRENVTIDVNEFIDRVKRESP